MSARLTPRGLLTVAALTSACGLLYSQITVRALVLVISDALTAQTWSLSVYLAALGLGAYAAGSIAGVRSAKRLLQIEFALALTGALAVLWIYAGYFGIKMFLHEIASPQPAQATADSRLKLILLTQAVTLCAGLLSGAELTLLLRLGRGVFKDRGTSYVLAANYAGAILATLIFVWLLPWVSPLTGSLLVAMCNLLIFVYLGLRFRLGYSAPALLLALLLGGLTWASPGLEQWHLKTRYLRGVHLQALNQAIPFVRKILLPMPDVLRLFTAYQTADFVPAGTDDFAFYLDGHPQLDPRWTTAYHETMVHIPILYFGRIPKRVLILGGGDGIAAKELLKYGDRVEHIDLVELDPWMIEMARGNRYFLGLNEGALANPKVSVHIEDAMQYLRRSADRYDAIYADFPLPFHYDLLKLYSVEIYRLMARHLSPDGYLSLDSAMLFLDPRAPEKSEGYRWNETLLNTLKAAGFEGLYPYMGSEMFVAARLSPQEADLKWRDLGVPLQKLDPAFLARSSQGEKRFDPHPDWVNSLFRPRLSAARPLEF